MTTATSSAPIYVIFVPKNDNAFHSFSVPRTTSFADIEQRIAQVASDAGRVNVRNGDTAYVVFDGAKTRDVEHAKHMATEKGLRFIPPELVLALRARNPFAGMRGVREEFNRRNAAYVAHDQKARLTDDAALEKRMRDLGFLGKDDSFKGFEDIFSPRR